MNRHGHALDISAIADALQDAAQWSRLLAIAYVNGTDADVKAAAEVVAKHANRVHATANALQSRISNQMQRRARI